MQWAQEIGSPKSKKKFADLAEDLDTKETHNPKPLCLTRWTVRAKAITSVINSYPVIVQFLRSFAESNEDVASIKHGFYTISFLKENVEREKATKMVSIIYGLRWIRRLPACIARRVVQESVLRSTRQWILRSDLIFRSWKNCLLLLVTSITSATAERSFSTLRMLKSYLRTTMTLKRLNSLSILHVYGKLTDDLNIEKLISEFINKNEYRIGMITIETTHTHTHTQSHTHTHTLYTTIYKIRHLVRLTWIL
ncbi:hypothetical protein PR048_010345 [Dryococelus australis]|uniref:HAT C-terminal dimerisation domain-containing protein n=1 Tax=Dryococelus australis TaxID=614101 RepID=A0ABQ9I2H7_9NEOP|nr:hypothetical protein PR048_010345 [Dryococelus australis]